MTEINTAAPPASLLAKLSLGILTRPLGGHIVLNFYNRMRKENLHNKEFWDAAVKELDVEYLFDQKALDRIPKAGPIILIANHHLGILDSLGMTHLLSKVRSDFKMMAIEKIKNASVIKGIQSQLIFVPNKRSTTAPSPRELALQHLQTGGALILFPSGFLAVPERKNEFAFDPKWKSGALSLADVSNASIVPMYFNLQNSSFYRNLTKIIPAAKHAMLITEAKKQSGNKISVTIGTPIKTEEIPGDTIQDKANVLRSLVYNLGLEEILANKPYASMSAKEQRLTEEHKKTIFEHLPKGMHLQIQQYVRNLFYNNTY